MPGRVRYTIFTIDLSAGCAKGAHWGSALNGKGALHLFHLKRRYIALLLLKGGCVGLLRNGRRLCTSVLMRRVHCITSLLGEMH